MYGWIVCLQCRKCFRRDFEKIYRKSRERRWRRPMLKAYKYMIYPNSEQRIQIAKHLAVVVLFITRHWHTGKIYTRKRKSLSVKQIVIITATEN